MSCITIESVNKKFGKRTVLNNVSLNLEKGHCYGILGRNGSGKSILINIIMQRTPSDKGKIMLDGKEIRNNDAAMSRLFCMNDSAFYPSEFRLGTILKITSSMFSNFDTAYAEKLMEKCMLNKKERTGRLSTGQNTVFKTILALASNADYIFLDEPVLGVDTKLRELIYTELAAKIAQERSCFVITTHLIDEISGLLEWVYVLHNGVLILSDATESISEKYISLSGKSDELKEFTREMNIINSENIGPFLRVIAENNDRCDNTPESITVNPIKLQELFNALTGGSANERN